MWFLGFSTTNPTNLWIIPAIILVILVTMILRKFATYLEAQAIVAASNRKTDQTDLKKSNQDDIISGKILTMCCHMSVIRTYALEELKLATGDFGIRRGVGATSFVYLAELGDGRFGAVRRGMEERGGSRKIFLDEVSVLLRISHPNLVGLLGFCFGKKQL